MERKKRRLTQRPQRTQRSSAEMNREPREIQEKELTTENAPAFAWLRRGEEGTKMQTIEDDDEHEDEDDSLPIGI